MRTYGYYSFIDNKESIHSCSRCSEERPLIVTCAGNFSTDFPFTTNNPSGRLDFYLMYIVSGRLDVSCLKDRISLSAGNMIVIPPNTPYRYTNDSEGHLNYLWVHFTGSHAKSLLDEYGIKFFPSVTETSDTANLSLRFKAIFDAYSKQDSLRDAELSALLDLLLIASARSITIDEADANGLVRSLKLINSSYNLDIRIPELAKAEHLSVSRYNFLFKKQFGVSPSKYILRLRMNCARDLLSSTDLSIKQISLLSGYTDPHFFSKMFKAAVGLSPSEYREKAKDNEVEGI